LSIYFFSFFHKLFSLSLVCIFFEVEKWEQNERGERELFFLEWGMMMREEERREERETFFFIKIICYCGSYFAHFFSNFSYFKE
jgi:hypothetical protein